MAFGHTKRGQELLIRFPRMADVNILRTFINTVIAEDTYIATTTLKSLKEETSFLQGRLRDIRAQDGIYLTAWVGSQLVGVCGIERRGLSTRTCHIGKFGISVAKKFRNQGVGRQIALATLETAKQAIPGLSLVALEVFAINHAAFNLYKKLGFKKYGQLPQGLRYHGQLVDEIFMYKKI